MRFFILIFLLLISATTVLAAGDTVSNEVTAEDLISREGWGIEFYLGAPYNFPTPLMINQRSERGIYLREARYSSRPFENPLYYSCRISRWQGDKGLELELLHQKLHLENKPAEVGHFEISHGYNLLTINRAWINKGFVFRVGGGVVLVHPDITVRNKTLSGRGLMESGYYLTGPVLSISAGRVTPVTEKIYLTAEGKITAAYAEIPVSSGESIVPNISLHLLLGLGYRL